MVDESLAWRGRRDVLFNNAGETLAPAGTGATWHNAPQPYICIVLTGEGEVVASDGTTRRVVPGDLIFFDDVAGKGHITRAITDLHVALINRAGA
jgi:quercetin dioxygenase-like cupin family protein